MTSGPPAPAGQPVISVVMPNYNGARLIARSLDSVLQQTFRELELIVVDDGSSDDSVAVVNATRDPRVRLIQQDHEGVCAARNRGIECARGAYIAFLDSDDTWTPDCLERLHGALLQAPEAALAYCGWQNIGLGGDRDRPFIPPDYETPDKVELWLRNSRWPIHAALTRKAAIVAAGGFNRCFPTSEDFLLWLEIVVANRIVRVPEVLAFYYHHEGPRATRDRVRMALNHFAAQDEFLRKHPGVRKTLGRRTVRAVTVGELLDRGYECYWRGELDDARRIFRRVMRTGYGGAADWKRMLPAWLPPGLHRRLLGGRATSNNRGTSGVHGQ